MQQIRRHWIAVATIRRTRTTLLLDRTQARLPHQTRHAMLAAGDPWARNSAWTRRLP
ncbi:MAG TPA: hypothetical protein VKR06_36525 [Ktedonosporobacter sp.]|nr:hypothetical protein [Ktedonosporobacter sp.]